MRKAGPEDDVDISLIEPVDSERALQAAIVEAESVAIATTDLDGRIVQWNRGAERRFGWRASEAIGRSVNLIVPADRRSEIDAMVWRLQRGHDVAPFEATRHTRAGGEVHVYVQLVPVKNELGAVVAVAHLALDHTAFAVTTSELAARAERERNAAHRYRRIFAANLFGVCYGAGRRIFEANDVMLRMMGADRHDLEAGIPLDKLLAGGLDGVRRSSVGDGEGQEFEISRPDGSTTYIVSAALRLAPDPGWVAIAVDVTHRKEAERDSEYRALHDALTGLPNRRVLVDRLEHALARSNRRECLTAVLFCDLDHFKQINDDLGHFVGDQALQAVARRLELQLRESDTVARTGGDEFVALLEDLAAPEDAAVTAERIRVALATPVIVQGHELNMTCSIGISLSGNGDDRVEALLGRADLAMYVAKRNGRDQIALGADEPGSRAVRRSVIDLRDGRSGDAAAR